MRCLSVLFIFLLVSFSASAQNVKVGRQPSAVFSPTAGGYILRQPGPAHNVSLTPLPVNPPSGGIKGVGAFSGGKKFRLNGNQFEMGGKYDMPVPKTNQKANVTAISKIPRQSLSKAMLKALPLVGNAFMLADILDAVKNEWDESDPSTSTQIDLTNGTVFRDGSESCTCAAPQMGSCGSMEPGGNVPSGMCVIGSYEIYDYPGTDIPPRQMIALGAPSPSTKKQLPPEAVLDEIAPTLTDDQIKRMMDHVQDSPKGENVPFVLPSDLPTEVTGPPTTSPETKTTTKTDGNTTTTTTTTFFNYLQNVINIVRKITTVTRSPSGAIIDNSETEETDTPPDLGSDPGGSQSGPGLCELYPDILACQKLTEPPPEDIPKRTETITLQTGPSFAGGGCIPDVTVNVFGTQVTALAMAVPCGWISDYLKPFILLLASLSAVFIIYPKND